MSLVVDDDAARGPVMRIDHGIDGIDAPASIASDTPIDLSLQQQVDALQSELNVVREELNIARRRDETLNFYMHRLDEELRLAARLQQDFLPKQLPQVGPVHFHSLYRPAGYVSGDLYDVMRLDEKHVGFYMADAVGHGMPAALLTMFIKNAMVTKEISGRSYRLLTPGESLARLNEALVGQNLSQATFATAVYGVINVETLEATYACAGHPNPILLDATGSLGPLPGEGGLLGIFPEEKYENQKVKLNPGDRVFIYTDGIEVAFNDDHFTDALRWRAELYGRRGLSTEELLVDFSDHLDRETGSLTPKDDLTMIVLEVK
ncbi:MAG: PP2C family protein-serine/threonine phosphatase [Tepidisphaeraceae bacterium]